MTPVEQLAIWVAQKHSGQLIKKTNEPYFNHLISVAEMAGKFTTWGYEIGLCHDLLEDTPTTKDDFFNALISFNYDTDRAHYITDCVLELTDVFTSKAYPDTNKHSRKLQETLRLCQISAAAQTVKYADLAYNIKWVLTHDPKHAKDYLERKRKLLLGMNKGNRELQREVLALIDANSLAK